MGEPLVRFEPEMLRHDWRHRDDAIESPDAQCSALLADDLRRGRPLLSGEPHGVVDATVPNSRAILRETADEHARGPGKSRRHEIPGQGTTIAAVAAVGPQQYGRNVGEFREHELNDRAAIEIGTIEVKNGCVASHEFSQAMVAHRARATAGWGKVLWEDATVPSRRSLVDRLGEPRVSNQVLQRKKFAAEINAVAALLFAHERRARVKRIGVRESREKARFHWEGEPSL